MEPEPQNRLCFLCGQRFAQIISFTCGHQLYI